MVQVAGKYQFVESKNLPEFLKALGVDEAHAKPMIEDKGGFELKVDGNKISFERDDPRGNSTFTVGVEYDETFPNGTPVKNIATLNGAVLEVSSKTKEGVSAGSKVYNFTNSGLELVATIPKDGKLITATRIFKRV